MPHVTGRSGAGDDEGPHARHPRVIKPKLYLASSVLLVGTPDRHRAENGGRQFTILCRTTSVRRLTHILGTTLSHMTDFAGAHVDHDYPGRVNVVPVDEIDTIYYRVDHCVSGERGWFKYERPDWLAKRYPL